MTDVLKPFMSGVKELLESGEDELERDANNIIEAVAGNPDLMGDDAEAGLDKYLSGQAPTMISRCSIFKCITLCVVRYVLQMNKTIMKCGEKSS